MWLRQNPEKAAYLDRLDTLNTTAAIFQAQCSGFESCAAHQKTP
jgi:hypothetical protein